MKSFTTFAGAQRAADGRPILRILRDPAETWIVLQDLQVDISIYTATGRRYDRAGSIEAMEIASR